MSIDSLSVNTAQTRFEIVDPETYRKREKEKAEARRQLLEARQELSQAKKELEQQNQDITAFEGRRQEDGSYKADIDIKKMSRWQKIKRGAGNFLQGSWKVVQSFVCDEHGKFDKKRTVKNVAIAAAAIGATFIPVVGPFIGYGLLALGAVSGGIQLHKGIKQLKDADTAKEFDKSWQDIGAGTFITGSSLMGMKGMSKTTSTGAFSGLKNFLAAPFKALKSAFKTSKQDVRTIQTFAQRTRSNPNAGFFKKATAGIGGFFKTMGHKINKAWNQIKSKDDFDASKKKMDKELEAKIQDLEHKVDPTNTATTADQKAAFDIELKQMQQLRSDLAGAKSKAQWDALKPKDMSSDISTLSAAQRDAVAVELEAMNKQAEGLTKQIEALQKLRLESMSRMASKRHYREQVKEYNGDHSRLANLWDLKKANFKQNFGWFKTPFGALMHILDIPFKPGNYVMRRPAGGVYALEYALSAHSAEEYLFDSFKTKSKEQGDEELAQLIAARDQLQQEITSASEALSQFSSVG